MSKKPGKGRKITPKKTEAGKETKKVERVEPKMPSGRAPTAHVSSRHGPEMIEREGRGFSLGELSGAGLPVEMARKWKVRTDVRRRTILEGNVGVLLKWNAKPKAPESPKGEPKAGEKPVRKRKPRKTAEA